MSVPVTEPAAEVAAVVEPEAPTTPLEGAEPKVFDADYVSKLRAEAAKHRLEAKANAAAAAELAAIKESQKTEAQKLADQLAAAQAEVVAAKREAFAATKGVPSSLVTGSTPEEWEATVAAALEWKGDVPKLPAAAPAYVQGNVGEPVGASSRQVTATELSQMTAEKKYVEINQARAAGRLNDLLGPA